MIICIGLNTLVLTISWYGMPSEVDDILNIINYIFSSIFILEAIVKIISDGKVYFYDRWNLFDFVVVVITILSIILDLAFNVLGAQTTIIRAFRAVRILKLVKSAKVLRLIIDTLILTIPSMVNVGTLLLLVYYIYAILGV